MKEEAKKKIINKPAFFLGLSFIVVGCTLGISSLAWLASPKTNASIDEMTGEATGSYFEKGDGTEANPYGIANAKQLYYFSWLQDMGFFNEVDSATNTIPTTYFELMGDIDASGYVLPPCGTETYPFVSNFDAKNYTISNLTISNTIETDYITQYPTRLNGKADGSDETGVEKFNNQASIVGFFGIIGEYTDDSISYDSSANKVTNLYLDNLTIKTKKSNLLVGIFAGYVNGLIDNCGVHYAKMDIDGASSAITGKFSDVSSFTLIGSYNNVKYSYSQGGSGGSGTDYGTSTDIRNMYEKLKVYDSYMSGTTVAIPKANAIPFNFDSSSSIVAGSGKKTVSSSGNSINASYASTLPVASSGTNIGYYSGGEIKVYEDYFDSSKVNFDNMKTAGNSQISVDKDTEHIDKIKTFLKTEVASSSSRLGDTAMVLSGTYFGDGSSTTNFPSSNDHYLVVKDAKVGTWSGDLFIPARGIWVAPTKPGRFEFVGINTKSTGFLTNASISIVRLKRSTPKDYSTGFSNTTYMQGTNFDNDMCGCTIYGGANAYVPYYYGVDVTQDDIDNGYEFFITKYASDMLANPYIVYIDIGTSGSEGSTTKPDLGDFDFVTKDSSGSLTKIKNYDADTNSYVANDSYVASEVTFKIEQTTADTILAFRRLSDAVYYYESPAVLSPSSTGTKTSSSKEDCTSA